MTDASFDYWDFFVAETQRNAAPLYGQLARGVAKDDELKAFANTARTGQPPANILFAAVHYLLLRGARHRLRDYYPNLNDGRPVADPGGAFPAFRDFVAIHRDELAPLVRTRVTNTNEIGRSAVLHAGFRVVAQDAGEPLHLIEVGPSAGLNLIWDSYGVRYAHASGSTYAGDPEARLVLPCEARGDHLPPAGRAPMVAHRVGLERSPVDLSRPEERDWLRALVWPDQVARFDRLEAAMGLFAAERPSIREGDALELLPEALSEIPPDETTCVYHSFVTYQFSDANRVALDDLLVAASVRRPVWRLSWEGTLSGEAPLLLHCYRNGVRDTRLLANAQPHGAWMEWKC
jgi:hypothetical protein